jgi:hypothetical protein
VLVELRYVSPFVLILLVSWISRVEFAPDASQKFLQRAALIAVAAPVLAVAWPITRDARNAIRNPPFEDWQVATALPGFGVPRGSALAYVGSGGDAYWAHLAGDRLIAEIPGKDQTNLLAADPEKQQAALHKLQDTGAQAVITKNARVASAIPGWQRIRDTQYFIWRPHDSSGGGKR